MKAKNDNILRMINNMALPLILNSLTGTLMGLLDQALVGRLSVYAYGAVGVVSTTIYSITGIIGMLAVSFNILGAQNRNSDNNFEYINKFNLTQIINVLIGVFSVIIIQIFKYPILNIFFNLEGEILEEAVKYLNIYSLTIGLNLILFTFSSLFKILDITKFIFYGNIIANISNLAIDYVLIYGKLGFPKMGVVGAAIGSVAGLTLNALYYLFIIVKLKNYNFKLKMDYNYLKQLIKKTFPLMGQELLDGTIFSIVTIAIVSRIGVTEVAVFTLLFNIVNILLMPMYAYSSTSLNYVGRYLHTKSCDFMFHIPKSCLRMAVLFYFVLAIILTILKQPLLNIMVKDYDVIQMAAVYFLGSMIAYFFNVPHSIYKNSLQGINNELWVFIISLASNVFCLIIMIYMSMFTQIKFAGVYISLAINYFCLSIFFYIRYKKIISKDALK